METTPLIALGVVIIIAYGLLKVSKSRKLAALRRQEEEAKRCSLLNLNIGLAADVRGHEADFFAREIHTCLSSRGATVVPLPGRSNRSASEARELCYRGVDGTKVDASLILASVCRYGGAEDAEGFTPPRTPAYIVEATAHFYGPKADMSFGYTRRISKVKRMNEILLREAISALAEELAAMFVVALEPHRHEITREEKAATFRP